MNAIQFGRWLGERRHMCGWPSQRALAAAAQNHPYTGALHISEAFLARLEAGLLSHPFRGTVRERVLALAWLVCKTPRQVRGYLTAAGCTDLTADETHRMEALRSALSASYAPPAVRLPRRSPRLTGRLDETRELARLVMSVESGCVAVTGLAGVGKSVVAAEALHVIATEVSDGRDGRGFPDGIVTFDCTGRIGVSGLQSLLEDVAAVFVRDEESRGSSSRTNRDLKRDQAGSVARATDLVRSTLHGRRALLLLDGVDPRFPLTQALEALLAEDVEMPEATWVRAAARGRVVLVTSRYLPLGSQLAGHLRLRPLDPPVALELLERASGASFDGPEREAAMRLCEMSGGVPLALEEIATAVAGARLPLGATRDPLLAIRLLDHQAGVGGMRERVGAAIGLLDRSARHELMRLASSDTTYTATQWQHAENAGDDAQCLPVAAGVESHTLVPCNSREDADDSGVSQAPAIAQLVRHSLIEPIGDARGPVNAIESHYRINPLVRALVLSGTGEDADSDSLATSKKEADTVRFLRRGAARSTAHSTLDEAKQRRAHA